MSVQKLSTSVRLHLALAVLALVTVIVCRGFKPEVIPIAPLELLRFNADVIAWLPSVLVLFGWGIGVNVLAGIFARNIPPTRDQMRPILVQGCLASIIAGVFEEVQYRFLLFLAGMAWMVVLNAITLGFAEWFYVEGVAPLVDVMSLRQLHGWLFHPNGWQVGAGLVLANLLFRDTHRGQSGFNLLNSWFLGLYFFWLLLHAGLFAAILIHFLYDLFVILTHKGVLIIRLVRNGGRLLDEEAPPADPPT